MQQDTIFALSTPPGKSAVAVIRLSGVACAPLFLALTQRETMAPPRQAILSKLYGSQSQLLDKALFLYFKAPHSFTGEEMLEIHTHGGMAIINAVLHELEQHDGVRPAEPGEFMRRAFYNDKADLLEAEAIADMIDAETAQQLRQATRQMQGDHSEYYHQLRNNILEILALLEAYIDFPEEDIPPSIFQEVLAKIAGLARQIESSLNDNAVGQRLRSGFRISIAGAPNVGKSTLLNALAGRKAAIVSSQAGTTRDIIELPMDISGYPVLLCDTAGIHDTREEVEKLGIELSHQSLQISDINLLMVDATNFEISVQQALNIHHSKPDGSTIFIINKVDALDEKALRAIAHRLASDYPHIKAVSISAQLQQNLTELEAALAECLSQLMPGENSWITRSRHRALLVKARQHLMADHANLALELCCEEIRLAANSIGKITGKIIPDDLLEVIFSRFCIGK